MKLSEKHINSHMVIYLFGDACFLIIYLIILCEMVFFKCNLNAKQYINILGENVFKRAIKLELIRLLLIISESNILSYNIRAFEHLSI